MPTPLTVVDQWKLSELQNGEAAVRLANSASTNHATFQTKRVGGCSQPTPSGVDGSRSLAFHSADEEYVSLDTKSVLRDTDDFSLSLWYCGTEADANDSRFGRLLVGSGANDISANLQLVTSSTNPSDIGKVEFRHLGGGDTIQSLSRVNDGTWHHIAYVNHGGTVRGDLYVDGVAEVTAARSNNRDDWDALGLHFYVKDLMRGFLFSGSTVKESGAFTDGMMADVRIFSGSLAASDVRRLAGLPADTSPVAFTDGVIRDRYAYAYGVGSADIDGDGDVDLTSADTLGTTSTLYWFENDGSGAFTPHVIITGEPGWLERHDVKDINGDGRPDIVIVNNRDGWVIAFLAPTRPATDPWERRVITTQAPRAYDVAAGDLDGDGNTDVAVAGYASGTVAVYRNTGSNVGEWPKSIVDSGLPEVRTIRVADINRDGKADLLAAASGAENVPAGSSSGSVVAWYENRSTPGSLAWTKHVIDSGSRAPIHGQAVDIDKDGDLDVAIAFGLRDPLAPKANHQIAWYENVGSPGVGSLWTKHLVGDFPYAFEAVASDIDGDGDIDVAATAWAYGDRVAWFENTGDPKSTWVAHIVRDHWNAANQLILVDVTGDGRSDIVATADSGSSRVVGANELRWWRSSPSSG